MENDPDLGLRRCIAEELAPARFRVRACQERAARSAEQLVDAQIAMVQAIHRLNEAKDTLERINGTSWVQLDEDD